MEKWFDVPEKEGSSVICSRVRLVRNWREYPFPGKMTKEQSVEMTGRLMNGVKESGAVPGSRSRYLYLDRIPDLERTALLERRAISRGVSKKKAAAGLVLSEDERLGITINGDDHIRIQAVEKGAALTECYRRADQMEELLGSRFEYSFDEKYGYLTSFPTSVGTGLRASVVLHLPALSRRKNFNSLTSDMGRFGTLVRGLYGEGEENPGSLYQISNQKTLGQTEKEITGQFLEFWVKEKFWFLHHNDAWGRIVVFCVGFKERKHINAAHAFAHMFNRAQRFLLFICNFSGNGKHLLDITVHGVDDFMLTAVFSVVGINSSGKIIQIQLIQLVIQQSGRFKGI